MTKNTNGQIGEMAEKRVENKWKILLLDNEKMIARE